VSGWECVDDDNDVGVVVVDVATAAGDVDDE
jgi:hypothetical protein